MVVDGSATFILYISFQDEIRGIKPYYPKLVGGRVVKTLIS